MLIRIPAALIILRILLGFVILLAAVLHTPYFPGIAITLTALGLLSDVFDGIIARKLGVATEKLRRWDSSADQVFFLCLVAATWIECPLFFREHIFAIGLLVAAEALAYLVSFIKFKKEIATHSLGAKLWSLVLVGTLVQVMATCDSSVLFAICFWLGLLTRLEIILITLYLPVWTSDVPSLYHAIQLRKGKEIKRNKLFN